MAGTHVICGGGVAGLVAALRLADRRDGSAIVVIERSAALGGLLKTFDYGPNGRFDCGMHFWTETGHAEFDRRIKSLLPGDSWEVLSGTRRDLSGLFFGGRLQQHSQFPDLRTLPEPERRACVADFMAHVESLAGQIPPPPDVGVSFQDHARRRFGRLIADRVVVPIAERNHALSGDQLDAMARFLPLLDRIILFDETPFSEMMGSDVLRALVAYPEQRRLPAKFAATAGSFYPRAYGIGLVIDALVAELKRLNVTILTEAQITGITTTGQAGARAVGAVKVQHGARSVEIDPVTQLIWASPLFGLAPLLGVATGPRPTTHVRRTVLVHLALARPPAIGDLYCFFVGDASRGTYRVTNYPAYCPGAATPGRYPITLEMIVDGGRPMDHAALTADGLADARMFGLLGENEMPVFSAVEVLPSGFPTLAIPAVAAVNAARTNIEERAIGNLMLTGILARPNLFFQTDILRDLVGRLPT